MSPNKLSESTVAKIFAEAFAHSLSQSSAMSWSAVAEVAPGESLASGDALHFRVKFEGALQGEASLALERADLPTLELGATDETSAAGDAVEEAPAEVLAVLKTCEATFTQSISHYGSVTITIVPEKAEPASDESTTFTLHLNGAGKSAQVELWFSLNSKFSASIKSLRAEREGATEDESSANLDLVLDVELNVTLRFGQRQLSLREVLDLTSGSVVELDRQVDEPVELVLDGKVVARGEAVIIDGNYGMRITQVLQPMIA
jgi:flagellar motor switch protein FliN/FliY